MLLLDLPKPKWTSKSFAKS